MPSGQEVKLVQALFDFVELDNGMKVPSRIHSYYGPLPEQQDAYFIQQWRGTYTGEAKSEDFVMEMSVDVRIDVADENVQRQIKDQIVGHSGLFNVYEFVERLGVDLVDSKTSATSLGMSDRDIVSVYDGSVDNVEPAEKSTLSSILRSLFVCFGLVAIISFLMAIWMRRSRYSIESES